MPSIKARKGFVIVFTLAMTGLLLLIAASLGLIASGDIAMANSASDNVRAYYLAEAGLAKKFVELRSGNTGSINQEAFTLATGRAGTISANVSAVTGGYLLNATGRYRNAVRNISMTVKRITIARFAYFSNSESRGGTQPIWFVTRDSIRGPLHTNGQLNISGNPVFYGPVSSVASTINYYHGGPPLDNPDFRQTLTLGAPAIAFPSTADMIDDVKTAAQSSGGLYLNGNTNITLLPNGTMNVSNWERRWNNRNMALPSNHALFVNNGDANVAGILNGQVTIGTNGDVVIVNNILYNTDPRITPTSTDTLGLVSQNNVIVDSNAPYNLEIDAYIVALNTSFTVENYSSGLKGTLTVYGGITQQVRGAVGTFNSSTNNKVSGYTKDYYYDERFQETGPWYFAPAKDPDGRIIYIKDSWTEY